jgi:hypothetical protein
MLGVAIAAGTRMAGLRPSLVWVDLLALFSLGLCGFGVALSAGRTGEAIVDRVVYAAVNCVLGFGAFLLLPLAIY